MNKNKHFGLKKLIPCYTEEGRCKYCRQPYELAMLSIIPNAWALADKVLEPVRERYGKPIKVKRCFLCHRKMKKVRQKENDRYGYYYESEVDVADYLRGEAADICALRGTKDSEFQGSRDEVIRNENLKIGQLIEELGEFDQLVYEDCDEQGRPAWIHVTYKRNRENRRMVLKR